MSKTYISAALRREVIVRAQDCCEYCRTNTEDRGVDYAIDHVIAEKHGGATTSDNLCLSCFWCNSYKGSDLSSVDWAHDGAIVPLFNPRQQAWQSHFRLEGARIVSLTATGRVTASLLQLNDVRRIKERRVLIELGTYPCAAESEEQ